MTEEVNNVQPVVEEAEEHKLTHKEKRYARIKKRLFKENDIKYEGPLSYRAIHIIAWLFLAFGQVCLLNSIGESIVHWNPLGNVWSTIFSVLGSLSTPLFILASFGLVLNGRRDMRDFMLVYGLAYLGVGLGFIFFYLRYINGLFVKLGIAEIGFLELIEGFLSDKVQVNVFADLFSFALFHFFMNYHPKRIFKGKTLIVFRLFALLPIAFVITSYVLKISSAVGKIAMPFYVYPFLTTRSPLVYFVFVTISLWIKYRERWFLRLGATKEEYRAFLGTKRNSLSLSIHLTIIILIFVVFDILLFLFALIHYYVSGLDVNNFSDIIVSVYGVTQSSSLVLVIPFIFLYSYKRKHKDRRIDILIPIGGIALIVFVYIEGIYQFILNFLGA